MTSPHQPSFQENIESSKVIAANYDAGFRHTARKERRPHISYAELITMAIESTQDKMMTLKDIYGWISRNYPFFDSNKSGWQNSIRHNLSLNRCFYKVPRSEGCKGKGSFWKINYDYQNVKMNYRAKKYTYNEGSIQNIHSLTEILSDNNLILDNIGVNEVPYKKTTVFSGNLMEEEYFSNNDIQEGSQDKTKLGRLFSFK